jgi:hypothetical protein
MYNSNFPQTAPTSFSTFILHGDDLFDRLAQLKEDQSAISGQPPVSAYSFFSGDIFGILISST